jgi:hypothetical protein
MLLRHDRSVSQRRIDARGLVALQRARPQNAFVGNGRAIQLALADRGAF